MRGILLTYFPPLPRSVTTLQVGGLVDAFGNGITLPFLFIYLHNVRGIGLGVVGPIAGSKTAGAATLMLVLAMVIFAVGQCLRGAVHAPLVV